MKEVFWIGRGDLYSYSSKAEANEACINVGADRLATDAELVAAQQAGAQWCKCGWLQDTDDKKYPMQENLGGGCGNGPGIKNCGSSGTAGANCYGNKPSRNDMSKTPTPLPFSSKTNAVSWSQSGLSYCHVNEKTLLNDQLDQSVEFNIFGRYVRVLAAASKGDGRFHFSQVMVYDLNGTNIAAEPPATATATTTDVQYGTASTAIDKTTTPRGHPNIWHNQSTSRTDYWQVDLGSVKMITRVRIIQRNDYFANRVEGMRIRVLKTTDEPATDGTCVIPPTPIYPDGTTESEKIKIGDMILTGIDGQKALTVLRGIRASTATNLTNYGLTDSQAAAAYNKLYLETLNIRRAGWECSASWTPGTSTLTITNGEIPVVNMKVKKATGIPIDAMVTAVSGNTITLNRNTAVPVMAGKYSLPTGAVDQTVQTNGYTGRYVRLRPSLVSGDGFVQVSQVVIKDATGTNIARGKPVFTTSVYCDRGSCFQQGSATVDGVLTPRAGSGSWQPMTGNRTTEYMEVDLGSVVAISSIQVQGRPDCCNGIHGNDRMTGMRIEINQTARAADTAAPTIANQPITFTGDIDDAAYFSLANPIRSVTTVASIPYDKAATLAYYMRFNKGDIQVPVLDSTGNPMLGEGGIPRFNKIADNGETAATNIIMSVTKVKAVDPNASASSATKAATTSAEGVAGYNVPAPPNTSDWSAKSLNQVPQQKTAINLGNQEPIIVDPDTTDEQITAEAKEKGSFKSAPSTISTAVMKGATESTIANTGYSAPRQNESGVAAASGGVEKEVFYAGEQGGYSPHSYNSTTEANQGCINIGADGLATEAQLRDAQAAGAQWCVWAWLQNGTKGYPMQDNTCDGRGTNILSGAGTVGSSGANCYGYKPSKNDAKGYKTRPFNDQDKNVSWNRKSKIDTSACGITPEGVQTVKRNCKDGPICVDPAKPGCAQECPPGSTKGENGLCGTPTATARIDATNAQLWEILTPDERKQVEAMGKAYLVDSYSSDDPNHPVKVSMRAEMAAGKFHSSLSQEVRNANYAAWEKKIREDGGRWKALDILRARRAIV